MALHPLALQFAGVADAYERGRPEYDPGVVGAMAAELGLAPGGTILDLAAGTGKLTRALAGAGYDVTAVEPQASLREILGEQVGIERVRDGVAEQIPLPDASVEVVTVADAFHWFDRPRALDEIRRVLAPGGGLALFNTRPDWRAASWCDEFVRLVVENRVEHPHFDGRPWHEYVREAEGWSEPWEVHVTTYPPAETSRLLDQLASMSWIAAMAPDQRAAVMGRARDILESGHTPERLPLTVEIGLAALPGADGPGRGGLAPKGPPAAAST
jgi:SAM-dependent methyltransferase